MTRLALGLLVFAAIHLLPAAAPALRARLAKLIGEGPFKLLFTVASFAALILIVKGWKVASIEPLYVPPEWGRFVTTVLVFAAFLLLSAPYRPNNIKRFLRHPQLTGAALWGVAHLFANGEARSVLLFTGLAAWAVAEMLFINRRDGAWERPPRTGWAADLQIVAIGIVLFIAGWYLHPWLTGVSVEPG